MSSLTTIDLILTGAVLISTAITIFIVTLPKAYDHFDPGVLQASDFSQEDRKNGASSGFAYYDTNKNELGQLKTRTTVQVVVLGDIGRSPRMQYHALSLAKHGAAVQLVGYAESQPHPDVSASRFIKVLNISRTPSILQTSSRALFILLAPIKVLHQTWALYQALAYRSTASKYMLVQNPPSIPVLAIAVFVCFFRNTRLIIDWHNFGYSILALRLGAKHPLVQLSRWYEGAVSHGADAHITVTDAMRRRVKKDFGIEAVTLHDRPADQFQPLTPEARLAFLRVCPTTSPFIDEIEKQTRRVIVSSTSWTADEDFNVLLQGLVSYSVAAREDHRLPKLLVVITGKGPQKQHYLEMISRLETGGSLKNVAIKTAWLSITDYALMLASADMGICLHTSSSGVDLPMKVLDMFGAGIPVAGWCKYESWPELVREGENGVGFGSCDDLKNILIRLFLPGSEELEILRRGALTEGKHRWDDEWNKSSGIFSLSATP